MQMTTTVSAIHAWTMPSVVHLVADLHAVPVRSTWQVPAASSVRGLFIPCHHILSKPHIVRSDQIRYLIYNKYNIVYLIAYIISSSSRFEWYREYKVP